MFQGAFRDIEVEYIFWRDSCSVRGKDSMKTLHLIFSRFRQYWDTNRIVLVMFLLGGTLSAVVFTYTYGNLVDIVANARSEEVQYRGYAVTGSGDMSVYLEPEKVLAVVENELFEEYSLYSYIEEQGLIVMASPEKASNIRLMLGNDDLDATPNGIVLGTTNDSVGRIGDIIEVRGTELKIIGMSTKKAAIISFEQFQKMQLPIVRFTASTYKRQTLENDPAEKLLYSYFSDAMISTPKSAVQSDKLTSIRSILSVCGAYLVAMVSFMFMLRYLMDSMRRSTVVSMIVGASKFKIFSLFVLESMTLCALVAGAGIFLHWILFPSVFSRFSLNDSLIYTPMDYLSIFLMMMVVCLLVTVPFVIKYARVSPAVAIRKID